MEKDKKRKRRCFLYQPILIKLMVDLKTLETERFAPYQIQGLFWPTLINIFVLSPQNLDDIQGHMHLPIFSKSTYNLKFWTILNKIAEIQIFQLRLNRVEENVSTFFPQSIRVILKNKSIETLEDFIYYPNLYELFRLSVIDIGLFDFGFHAIYNHLHILSVRDAMNKTDCGKRSMVEHSINITNIDKLTRLKKMTRIFQFDTLKVSEFFGWNVYRLLTEAGLKTLTDVFYFEEIDTLIPEKNRREFHLQLSAVYYSFSLLEEIKKRIK
jgi:hypothetical protein